MEVAFSRKQRRQVSRPYLAQARGQGQIQHTKSEDENGQEDGRQPDANIRDRLLPDDASTGRANAALAGSLSVTFRVRTPDVGVTHLEDVLRMRADGDGALESWRWLEQSCETTAMVTLGRILCIHPTKTKPPILGSLNFCKNFV